MYAQKKIAAKAYTGVKVEEHFEATKPITPDLETTKRSIIERLKDLPKSHSSRSPNFSPNLSKNKKEGLEG